MLKYSLIECIDPITNEVMYFECLTPVTLDEMENVSSEVFDEVFYVYPLGGSERWGGTMNDEVLRFWSSEVLRNGERGTDNSQQTTVNGQRTTDNGQRTTDNGLDD